MEGKMENLAFQNECRHDNRQNQVYFCYCRDEETGRLLASMSLRPEDIPSHLDPWWYLQQQIRSYARLNGQH